MVSIVPINLLVTLNGKVTITMIYGQIYDRISLVNSIYRESKLFSFYFIRYYYFNIDTENVNAFKNLYLSCYLSMNK